MEILQKTLDEYKNKLNILRKTEYIGIFDTDYMSIEFYMNDGCFERIDSDEIIEGMKEYYEGLIKHTERKIEEESKKIFKTESEINGKS